MENLVFKIAHKNYIIECYDGTNGESDIIVSKCEKVIRKFTYPSYKVYNLSAHFNDIVLYEQWLSLSNYVRSPSFRNGYKMASWNGF